VTSLQKVIAGDAAHRIGQNVSALERLHYVRSDLLVLER
jgi:hypothetical protein